MMYLFSSNLIQEFIYRLSFLGNIPLQEIYILDEQYVPCDEFHDVQMPL